MTARQGTSGKTVNRMLHIDENSQDLLFKLEAVRLVCRERCRAARSAIFPAHDALNGIFQADPADRRPAWHRLQPAFPELSPRRSGPRPDARHRDDRRQGRPLCAPGSSRSTGASTFTSRERRTDGIVIRGTKDDRHRRTLYARIPGDALPDPRAKDRDFRGCAAPCPSQCARRDHRRATCRPDIGPRPRRSSSAKYHSQSRRRRDLRRCIRTPRSGFSWPAKPTRAVS